MLIDYAALKAAVSIEQAASMLDMQLTASGNQLRGPCPVCTSNNPRAIVITPSKGVFYCFANGKGGDLIRLAAHVLGVEEKDAAKFLAEQLGTVTSNVTVTSDSTVKVSKERAFDPVVFAEKLQYTDQVKALGYSEEEARNFRVGFYRGHVYIPSVYPSGAIAGWSKVVDGKLVRPTAWLSDTSNVIQLKKAG